MTFLPPLWSEEVFEASLPNRFYHCNTLRLLFRHCKATRDKNLKRATIMDSSSDHHSTSHYQSFGSTGSKASFDDDGSVFQFTGTTGKASRSIVVSQALCTPKSVTIVTSHKPAAGPSSGRGCGSVLGATTNTKAVTEWQPFLVPGTDLKTPGWLSYFEVIISKGSASSAASSSSDCIAIGLTLGTPSHGGIFNINKDMPGWPKGSCGYHSDDGTAFVNRSATKKFGPVFGAGDTVGCGIDWRKRNVFYTLNGVFLGYHSATASLLTESPLTGEKPRKWYPAVGLDSNCKIQLNFGTAGIPFVFDLQTMLHAVNAGEAMVVVASEETKENAKDVKNSDVVKMTTEATPVVAEPVNHKEEEEMTIVFETSAEKDINSMETPFAMAQPEVETIESVRVEA